ncbi:hypothetical protein Poly30_26840 [Planctomycetes bacterium Poly30]|uniref:Uncharacterized protein n=1 Tax=Saltatorellus ferox TaxID=2528018 RepID=A0A518ESX4_9BACT|nr:hypothetical protein Poly30_26840 [Planctomycetes bacterium Poly30]
MNRSLFQVLGAALLASTAAAQGTPLPFTIDAPASQFTFSGTTSLGPVVGNPNTFGISGLVEAELAAGLTGPIGSIRLTGGGSAVVSPDINASIPNPLPFLPPLAQISITGLSLALESATLPVGPTGAFSGTSFATFLSGTVQITPLGQSTTTTDLTGAQTNPQPITGMVSAANQIITLTAPLNISFTEVDPATGLSATIDLMGTLLATHTIPQPVNYCTAVANSTGIAAAIGTTGNSGLNGGNLALTASALPQNSLGFFLFAEGQAFVPMFGGSAGNLCLGGQLFRLSNFVQSSGGSGQVALPMPYGGLPGGQAFDIGDQWNFQYWFRDQNGGVPTSNTTDAITLVFAP